MPKALPLEIVPRRQIGRERTAEGPLDVCRLRQIAQARLNCRLVDPGIARTGKSKRIPKQRGILRQFQADIKTGPERVRARAAALVTDDGTMFVATINRTVKAFLFAIVGAEYVLRWLPRGTHQWRRFCKPTEIETVLRQSKLTVLDRRGVRVNPITRAFSLSSDLGVNYMFAAERSC